jgi:hypothetical protein
MPQVAKNSSLPPEVNKKLRAESRTTMIPKFHRPPDASCLMGCAGNGS